VSVAVRASRIRASLSLARPRCNAADHVIRPGMAVPPSEGAMPGHPSERNAMPDRIDESRLKVQAPKSAAAGITGVKVALQRAISQMGVKISARTLLKLNQADGFDCMSCAWPDPEHRHTAEFCENGVKAVADEPPGILRTAQPRRPRRARRILACAPCADTPTFRAIVRWASGSVCRTASSMRWEPSSDSSLPGTMGSTSWTASVHCGTAGHRCSSGSAGPSSRRPPTPA
jgi:hypothetical protein